jgi:uncharacterized protein YuzE
MKIRYFADTDTAYLEFSDRPPAETREVNEDVLLDIDDAGEVVGMTIEHASAKAAISELSFQQVANSEAARESAGRS